MPIRMLHLEMEHPICDCRPLHFQLSLHSTAGVNEPYFRITCLTCRATDTTPFMPLRWNLVLSDGEPLTRPVDVQDDPAAARTQKLEVD